MKTIKMRKNLRSRTVLSSFLSSLLSPMLAFSLASCTDTASSNAVEKTALPNPVAVAPVDTKPTEKEADTKLVEQGLMGQNALKAEASNDKTAASKKANEKSNSIADVLETSRLSGIKDSAAKSDKSGAAMGATLGTAVGSGGLGLRGVGSGGGGSVGVASGVGKASSGVGRGSMGTVVGSASGSAMGVSASGEYMSPRKSKVATRVAPKPLAVAQSAPTTTPTLAGKGNTPNGNLNGEADGDSVGTESQGGKFEAKEPYPMTSVLEDSLSTFAIDVDTGSYRYAARFMQQGQAPRADAIRVEEWVNAFHYNYAGPEQKRESSPFAVDLEAGPAPWSRDRYLMRVAVQGKRISAEERKKIHLTFLVDISGSMQSEDKLPLAKQSLHLLVDHLKKGDSVALVTYAGATGVVLPKTDIDPNDKRALQKIHDAIENLSSGGGTDMGSGMELAYREATKALRSDVDSRVIIVSDGDANIGRTGHEEILKSIKGYVSEGVALSAVGYGTGNYNDHLMEQLADAGNGNYTYVASPDDAQHTFVDNLTGMLSMIAQDVKIQVEFDEQTVDSYRLIGYENRNVADQDFRNDKVDGGEIGAGHTVTALYELILRDGGAPLAALKDREPQAPIATVHIRAKQPRGQHASESSEVLTVAQVKERFADISTDTQFATGVAVAAEVLRKNPSVAMTLPEAIKIVEQSSIGSHQDERKKFAALLRKINP